MPAKKTRNNFQIHNIEEIIKLEERDRIAMGLSDRIASAITAFSGSMLYVCLHVIWFAAWVIFNSGVFHLKPFDPFPFNFLTMAVSLEAIFLSSFVLISQNKQALQADKRAKIDLQVNMIAEQENTKLLEMIVQIHQHLGIKQRSDKELKELEKKTDINKLAKQIDKAETKAANGKPPSSAADTSK